MANILIFNAHILIGAVHAEDVMYLFNIAGVNAMLSTTSSEGRMIDFMVSIPSVDFIIISCRKKKKTG